MPRSIQQLKHRVIFFDTITVEQIAAAVRVLEQLPGVSASADVKRQCIVVDYWVDEYTLAELEQRLAERGFLLFGGVRLRILRTEIQCDEEKERDEMGARALPCRSGGVFARVYRPSHDDFGENLPSYA